MTTANKKEIKEMLNDKQKMLDDKTDKNVRFIRSSLASEILHDLKVENITLKVLLVVSILLNVIVMLFKV